MSKAEIRSNNYKHGHRYARNGKPSRTYGCWCCMKRRVFDKKRSKGRYYKIEIESDWLIFENFLEDVGEAPSSKHTIDRIDNNKGYIRGNVVWSDAATQSRNKTNNVIIHNMCLKD